VVAPTKAVVVYKPGGLIDTSRTLQVEKLPSRLWGPIQAAYPEVQAAGPNASFHNRPVTVIFRPTTMSKAGLERTARAAETMPGRTLYRWTAHGQMVGVLVHLHAVNGSYDSVHIYRLDTHVLRNALRGPNRRRQS